MALALDKTGSAAVNSGASVTITWSGSPASGSVGLVVLGHVGDPGAYTPPSGWTAIGTTDSSSGGAHSCYSSVWITVDGSTAGTIWNWTNSTKATICGVTYTGADTSTPQDASGDKTGNDATPTTKAGFTTLNANDVLVAMFAQASGSFGGPVFSAPTNSFTIQVNSSIGVITASGTCISDRIVSATGTYVTAVTSTDNDSWVSNIVAIQQAGGVVSVLPGRPKIFFTPVHPAQIFE